MATKVLQCPTFRTKNIFWCKSFWFIIQKTVKFQTNFFFPRTHFCWFSFHKKASVIFPRQAKDKNLARLTKTKLHCPRGQGLEFEASNWFVQILKFEKSIDDLSTRLDNWWKIFFLNYQLIMAIFRYFCDTCYANKTTLLINAHWWMWV